MCSGRNTHNDKYNSLVWEMTAAVHGRQFCSVFLGSWASHAGHKMWVFAPFSSLPSSVLLYAKTKAYITFCLLLLKILALNSSSGTCFPLSTKMRIKQKHWEFFLAPLTGGQPDRVFFFFLFLRKICLQLSSEPDTYFPGNFPRPFLLLFCFLLLCFCASISTATPGTAEIV